jgi:chromodomain-helicase-DNA-binding protein 4
MLSICRSGSLQKQYELCRPNAPNDLKAHVVITGYGTARTTVSFLRKFAWECLIVDEGQALKNDKSDLFQELCTLHVQHRIILTGTPLQNNIRELFNIMQFVSLGTTADLDFSIQVSLMLRSWRRSTKN